jgi:hypothetical protein
MSRRKGRAVGLLIGQHQRERSKSQELDSRENQLTPRT